MSIFDTNLEYYKVFYYVATCKGISAAAQKLSLSQPAVSQQIAALERSLGITLFKRNGRGITLTTEGKVLFQYVSKGYEEILRGEKQLSQMMHLDAGEVRVGASDMTLRFYLLPYLEKFHEQYPKIKVTVTNAPTPETLQYLAEDKIDFGVVSSGIEHPKHRISDNLKFSNVMEIQDCFVAGRQFMQLKNHMIDVTDLTKYPIISLEGSTSSGEYVTDFLKQHGVELQPEFKLATTDMIVQFAKRNLGIGMIVRNFAKEELESGKLFELRLNQHISPRHIQVVTDTQRPLSIAASKLLELL
ncbi:LysR family transcriptional regulator [Butyrivibrio sp. NC3005]|uniref:LysR family transcriptional regulator n=1 Tax=Butyrivibrio sp. NC3005 TaxID=1280685 RepID=UPI000420A0B1|nr:LysR family transcriptional regulator [Butyrivibrio sp. NC3005]